MIKLRTSLRFLQAEVVVTGVIIAMPIMVPFYKSIGMNQGEIGLSQSLFTIALLLLNIPTGWIADRFSRKICNAFGDFGGALALVLYSQATCFSQIVLCEILFGLTGAFSSGADGALIKGHTDKIDKSGQLFHDVYASNAIWRPIIQTLALAIGGLIGASNPRLAIALSAIPYAIGCVLSLFIREEGVRLVSQHKNPVKDMARVARETVLTSARLRWLILAYALGIKITNVMIWVLTPILIFAGVPMAVVAVGWILNSLAVTVGAIIARKFAMRIKKWQRFALPSLMVILVLVVMSLNLSIFTVWLYVVIGLAYGWNSSVLLPMIQDEIPANIQATALSVTDTFSRMIYVPIVWLVGFAGNSDVRFSMVATVIIFLPLILLTAKKLKNLEIE